MLQKVFYFWDLVFVKSKYSCLTFFYFFFQSWRVRSATYAWSYSLQTRSCPLWGSSSKIVRLSISRRWVSSPAVWSAHSSSSTKSSKHSSLCVGLTLFSATNLNVCIPDWSGSSFWNNIELYRIPLTSCTLSPSLTLIRPDSSCRTDSRRSISWKPRCWWVNSKLNKCMP